MRDNPSKQPQISTANPSSTPVKRGKKRSRGRDEPERLTKKGKGKAVQVIDASDSDLEVINVSNSEGDDAGDSNTMRRSSRRSASKRNYKEFDDDEENNNSGDSDEYRDDDPKIVQVKEEDVDVNNASLKPAQMTQNSMMDLDEEEKKLKPELQLDFRELHMQDLCLCVVVEPWPVQSADASTAEVVAGSRGRDKSKPPPSTIPPRQGTVEREQTPLFLPDIDERGRSVTPAPVRSQNIFSNLETMDDGDDQGLIEEETFGMLAFSQALNKVSGDRMGVADEDEDEMDGGALYGDADEMHGIIS
jgi:hypothetical protein